MDDGAGRSWLSKLLKKRKEETAEEEIVSILEEGQDQGIIEESEAEMISNIFTLNDKISSDIMTRRKNLAVVSSNEILENAMHFICDESFSRYPVFEEDIDHIVGILHIKDAAKAYLVKDNRQKKLCEIPGIFQKASFAPETSKLDSVFANMQRDKVHMQIIVDEYGQTAGVIAMEDILEAIVGEIYDEHDEVEYNTQKLSDNIYLIRGLALLEDITDESGITFPENEESDTLNGFLISRLDKIPDTSLVGKEITIDNITYKIQKVEDKTIALVKAIINN